MKINTSVFLLKENFTNEEDAFIEGSNIKKCKLGKIAIRKNKGKEPSWGSFINTIIDDAEDFKPSFSQGAAISLQVGSRVMVLCFAAGRFLINQDRVEDRFGLKTCLSLQTSNKFKDIKVKSLENSGAQKFEISPSWVELSSFSFKNESEIIKSVTAKVDDKNLGKTASGFDSLSVKIDLDKGDIQELCKKFLEAYESNEYKKKFDCIDKICAINKISTINELDKKLVEKIKNRNENVWMCIPDFVDWANIEYFKYLNNDNADDIDILKYAEELDKITESGKCVKFLKNKKITAYNSEGATLYKKSAYYCITAEIELNNKTYLLNESKWYEIEDSFSKELNALKIEIANNCEDYQKVNLLVYDHSKHKGEDEYNKACAQTGHFDLLDKKCIGQIEVCDLWSNKKEFIHVKRYSSSAVLSHLFNQGLVSATQMCNSNDFRTQIENKNLCKLAKPFTNPGSFSPRDCSVKFAIISKDGNKFNLPHFSLISYRQVKKNIEDMGFKVGIIKIPSK